MQINDCGKEGEKRERSDLSPFDIVPLLLLLFRPSSTRDVTYTTSSLGYPKADVVWKVA